MSQWLLLPGLARESVHWGNFVGLMADISASASVFLPDYPGMGRRYRELAPQTVALFTEDLRRQCVAAAGGRFSDGPRYIFAQSFGGLIALDWLARYPGEFDAAVLMNVPVTETGSPWQRLNLDTLRSVARLHTQSDSREREKSLLSMSTRLLDTAEFEALLAERIVIAERHPVAQSNVLAQVNALYRFQIPVEIKTPLLFLGATRDALVDSGGSERLARRFDADFCLHPAAGHDVFIDDPAWVVEQIERFLRLLSR